MPIILPVLPSACLSSPSTLLYSTLLHSILFFYPLFLFRAFSSFPLTSSLSSHLPPVFSSASSPSSMPFHPFLLFFISPAHSISSLPLNPATFLPSLFTPANPTSTQAFILHSFPFFIFSAPPTSPQAFILSTFPISLFSQLTPSPPRPSFFHLSSLFPPSKLHFHLGLHSSHLSPFSLLSAHSTSTQAFILPSVILLSFSSYPTSPLHLILSTFSPSLFF